MNALYFLLIPLVIVLVASLYTYLRGRRPTNLHSGVDGFRREMHALSPDSGPRPRRFDAQGTPPARPSRPDRGT